jgi:hypothetical protein
LVPDEHWSFFTPAKNLKKDAAARSGGIPDSGIQIQGVVSGAKSVS